MSYTPLGWRVRESDEVHRWVHPYVSRTFNLHPVFGFILLVWSAWYHRVIEKLTAGGVDEWGYAKRENRNRPGVYSEHAGGAAIDENAQEHPNGVPASRTFSSTQLRRMRWKANYWNKLVGTNVIRLGIDYNGTPDGMHKELFHKPVALKRLMRILSTTTDGKAVIRANPAHCRALKAKGYLR